jgi:hypothetical protein
MHKIVHYKDFSNVPYWLGRSDGQCATATILPELEFLKRLWGLGTEEEEGYRTGPPGYIGWRNSFLGIDSGAPYTFKNTSSGCSPDLSTRSASPCSACEAAWLTHIRDKGEGASLWRENGRNHTSRLFFASTNCSQPFFCSTHEVSATCSALFLTRVRPVLSLSFFHFSTFRFISLRFFSSVILRFTKCRGFRLYSDSIGSMELVKSKGGQNEKK